MEERANGFEIRYDETRNILTLRIHQLLNTDLGHQCEKLFAEHVTGLSAQKQTWCLLLDIRCCPPQSQDIQDVFGRMLNLARQQGMQKHALLVNRSITSVNRQLSTILPVSFYFQSEDAALNWLNEELT